jgi:hypothetical protein
MTPWMRCFILVGIGLGGPAASHAVAGLRCTPAAIDLGEVRGGPARQQRFELVNDGPDVIEILDVERGCGCLESRLDRRQLQPGEKASLVVELRTMGQPNGPRSWNIRVRFRDGDIRREALLVLAATIQNEVTVQPSMLVLHVKSTLQQEVVVTDRRAAPLKVTALHSSSPALRASILSTDGGVTKLQLEATTVGLGNAANEVLLSIYTDDSLYNPLRLPITLTRASNTSAIAATPSEVQAHVSAAQPIATTLVRLRRVDGQKVTIESAAGDDPGITCTWAAGPGTAATVRVQVDASRLATRAGPRRVRVRVAETEVAIPVVIDRGDH